MSFINNNDKEIHIKIVYYGPSLGGKTTNLQWVFSHTAEDKKSNLMALHTEVERTLFFDFLPMDIGVIRGFRTRLLLYSVPGQKIFDQRRKQIMTGLDGVIFVADSQNERMEENVESLKNLEQNLDIIGYNIREVPLIMQYNKRDLPNAAPLRTLRATLNAYNAPEFEAVASEGKGVIESLTAMSKIIINILKGGSTL
jgi:signal recognition particle receptor subunit beta